MRSQTTQKCIFNASLTLSLRPLTGDIITSVKQLSFSLTDKFCHQHDDTTAAVSVRHRGVKIKEIGVTHGKKKLYIIWGENIVEKIHFIFLIKENEFKKRQKKI